VRQRSEHPVDQLAQRPDGRELSLVTGRRVIHWMPDGTRPGHRSVRRGQHIPLRDRPGVDGIGEVKAQRVADDLDLDHAPIFSPLTRT
jgi:hypothetical protein